MKKTYIGFAGLSLLLLLGTQTVQAQQGFGTDKPNKSAAVDIQSSKRGLLIPRVELVETTNQAPITTPETSLMVYNQATANDVTPGYYYWDGAKWARFAKQSEITEITLDGDVTGTTGDTKVVAIQGTSVSNVAPTANQVLTYIPSADGKTGEWVPTNLPTEPWNVQGTTTAASKNNEDIYQQGKVAIGFTKDDVATKTLDVKGDFRTEKVVEHSFPKVETNYHGIVTNIVTLPGVNMNMLYSSNSPFVSYNEFLQKGNVSFVSNFVGGTSIVNMKDNGQLNVAMKATAEDYSFNLIGGNASRKSISMFNIDESATTFLQQEDGFSSGLGIQGQNGVKFSHKGGKEDNVGDYVFPRSRGNANQILVTDGNNTLSGVAQLSWKNALDILTPGKPNQVLITSKEGDKVTWVDQSDIVPTTTNTLTKKNNNGTVDSNTIVSTVNGEPAEVKVIDNVTNTVNGTSIVTSVNGVASGSVDLKDAIQAGQKITTVSEGNGVKVTPADKGNNTMDYNVAINTDGGNAGDVLTVVDGGTSGDTKVEWKKPQELQNIYTHDGTLTANNRTVNFGEHTVLKFLRGSQVYDFTFDNSRIGLNMWGTHDSSIGLLTRDRINGQESKLKLYHDNSLSQINANSEKGLRISAFAHKDISLGKFYFKPGEDNETFESTLIVRGDGGVQVTNINKPEFVGKTTDKIVVADEKGVLKTVGAAMPKVFYMPPVMFDTSNKGTGKKRNLYNEYVAMFGGTGAVVDMSGRPSLVKNDDAEKATIPVFSANELDFYVSYYDPKVFAKVQVDKNGELTYDIISKAKYGAFMTVVFVVRDTPRK